MTENNDQKLSIDANMRDRALAHSLGVAVNRSIQREGAECDDTSTIIERAEAFYGFLSASEGGSC